MRVVKGYSWKMFLCRNVRGLFLGAGGLIWLVLCVVPCGLATPATAQSQQAPTVQWEETATLGGTETGPSTSEQHPVQQLSGSISGTVIDPTGAVAVGAQVRIANEDQSVKQEVVSGDNGEFSFAHFPAGPFTITITAPG